MIYYLKGEIYLKPEFNLSTEKKQEMIGVIQLYYEQEQGEKLGNMKAMFLLDFIIEKLAPDFYNIGVEDCHQYMTMKIDDMFEIQK